MKFLFSILIAILTFSVHAQLADLKRKADLGFALRKIDAEPGAIIQSMDKNSPASKAGLKQGDKVLAINDVLLSDRFVMQAELRRIKSGDKVKVLFRRAPAYNPVAIYFIPLPAPKEQFVHATVESVTLTNDYGDRLRAFVTKPKQASGKLPAILFVSWLSCATVETTDTTDTWSLMLREVAEKSGALMLRLEKPGVGDSEGIPCSACDLDRELNGYQTAMQYLKGRSDVDTTNLIVFGGSLGGTLGAYVGKNHPVKAYVTAVSVYKTWLEHMIELERRRMFLSGKSQSETSLLMPGYVGFYTEYLVREKTPEQVLQERPEWKALWYDDKTHQYGRPSSFYHQVQQRNFFNQWSQVNVPVLIIAGEFDWIMTLEDSQILQQVINTNHPGNATLYVAPGMNHHWSKFKTRADAFKEENGTYDHETVAYLIRWLKGMTGQ
jgi:pimeloyl-ACP methyl ester carboxylesterase